ncbi:MAG: DUF268 domain-containing protein [Nitrospirota bacterium]|nr:DUF268 domain-containing protein [Nitrospirota bacterium]
MEQSRNNSGRDIGRSILSLAGRRILRDPAMLLLGIARYIRDYLAYRTSGPGDRFRLSVRYCYPCIRDRTATTPTDPIYLLQDTWAAKMIGTTRPRNHYDVGSSVTTMAVIAQFVPTTMVDIRPIDITVENLSFLEGSILNLPFQDGTIDSLSSLCVLEHVGLGRYGDPLDPRGSEKAALELQRVLGPGGNLYLSVPVDSDSRIYFNAHRTFTREHLLSLFPDMTLRNEAYIYGRNLYPTYDASRGFGTGLFHLTKRMA